ncbi:hypothetical protein LZ31DRAFT_140554 [Colletotrichum somersetense]|nr:hypothetical protein LZ31DRAFT_140554 [Colletotrichum somersetense]
MMSESARLAVQNSSFTCLNAPLDHDKLHQAFQQRDLSNVISKRTMDGHRSPTYKTWGACIISVLR